MRRYELRAAPGVTKPPSSSICLRAKVCSALVLVHNSISLYYSTVDDDVRRPAEALRDHAYDERQSPILKSTEGIPDPAPLLDTFDRFDLSGV